MTGRRSAISAEATPVSVLALDHYFGPDLDALAAHPVLRVRRISYSRLRNPAIRILGECVGGPIDVYCRAELAEKRARYAEWLSREVSRMYLESRFDVALLPSDVYFYVRALPNALRPLNIPLVVLQRETSLSPSVYRDDAEEFRRYAPVIADWMAVCSNRQRNFWLRAGGDGSRIVVTGQPRFDCYARPPLPLPTSRIPEVLFLGYQDDVYSVHAGIIGSFVSQQPWSELRRETEAVLIGLARRGTHRITYKPHPQQPMGAHVGALQQAAGDALGRTFVLADPLDDVRTLISRSNVVVGFQTTALYEAVAAGRPAVYAAWGEFFEAVKGDLLPFHVAPEGCVHHAASPRALEEVLLSGASLDPLGCRAWLEEALGPLDGRASERVADLLVSVARRAGPNPVRLELERRRRPFSAMLLGRATAEEALWQAAIPLAQRMGRRRGVEVRRDAAAGQRRLALSNLRTRRAKP